MNRTLSTHYTDWEHILSKTNIFFEGKNSSSNENKILMDGRAKKTFDFYNKGDHNIKQYYTWEPYDSLVNIINDEEKLVFLLNDYKSYTKLSVQQNWNAGKIHLIE